MMSNSAQQPGMNIPQVNNNPFSSRGRIERKNYFITKVIIFILFCLNSFMYDSHFPIYMGGFLFCILFGLFAASKRLRDIGWSSWLLLVWILPIIGLGIGIPLLFIKGKYADSNN